MMIGLKDILPRMRTMYVLMVLFCFHSTMARNNTGIPFTRNFSPADYKGHTQNFDIAEDRAGNIYVANFAGVLVYNGEDWNLVLTPDISRVTCVEPNAHGEVLVGGLNEIGIIKTSENGSLFYEDLRALLPVKTGAHFGEISEIISAKGKSFFFSRDKVLVYDQKTIDVITLPQGLTAAFSMGDDFLIRGEENTYYLLRSSDYSLLPMEYINPELEVTDVLQTGSKEFLLGTANHGLMQLTAEEVTPFEASLNALLTEAKISDLLQVNAELIAIGTLRNGVLFINKKGEVVTWVNRSHGLQNDYVNKLHRDKGNRIWVALNNGISLVAYPWPWTFYNRDNGLKSGVVSITRNKGKLLVGTYQGIYTLKGKSKQFIPIEGIETACWQFLTYQNNLLAATSEGIYKIDHSGVKPLTSSFALCLAAPADRPLYFYAGTLDGFSEIRLSETGEVKEQRAMFEELGEVTALLPDNKGNLWIATLNGQLAQYNIPTEKLQVLGEQQNLPDLLGNQFYYFEDQIIVGTTRGLSAYNYQSGQFEKYEIKADSSNGSLDWPGMISSGQGNSMWMTRGDETGLSHFIEENGRWRYQKQSFGPFGDFICRSIYPDTAGLMWFGGPSGLIRFDAGLTHTLYNEARVKISEIRLNGDSILFGGFGPGDQLSNTLSYNYRNIAFRFSSTGYNAESEAEYSFFLKGHDNKWSDWSIAHEKEYQKLAPGRYTFYVKSKDIYGNISDTAQFSFELLFPWYLKWYMILVYIVVLAYSIWLIVQWRLRSLVKEKEKLENTVRKRTSEIREQRDEIQKKSEELSFALTDLKNTQEELIRQEKLASVGQMTKGIVDRIINPLNYINNFSSLSGDLADDLKEVLEEEKETISRENFAEVMDISNMLQMNLGKIKDHGSNTVRIVKGMEELLKDRTGRFTQTNLAELITQIVKRIKNNFDREISEYGIEVDLKCKGTEFEASVITEELSKALYELFDNAVQSVASFSEKHSYLGGFVMGELECTEDEVILKVRDNGKGIPEKEVEQIFDPFFTTKPTAKGSGVGLYLVREIIYLHRGTISVHSEIEKETVFTIVLPRLKKN